MYKCEEVPIIKSAILSGDKEYKEFRLPTVQTAGTSMQIDTHAGQLADKFYDDKIQATYDKKLIPNDKFIEVVCELTDRVVVAQFGGTDKIDDGTGEGIMYTDDAQDFFNEVYDEFEYLLNNSLNVWADN